MWIVGQTDGWTVGGTDGQLAGRTNLMLLLSGLTTHLNCLVSLKTKIFEKKWQKLITSDCVNKCESPDL